MNGKKTAIAVLASHDSDKKNKELVKLLDYFVDKGITDSLKKYQFIFTGGTFDRVIVGTGTDSGIKPVNSATKEFLFKECGVTKLPPRDQGGVAILSYFIVQQKCSIVWAFLDPMYSHWLMPENLAFLRLCDQWRIKKLMNKGSVEEWFNKEAEFDKDRNEQTFPLKINFIDDGDITPKEEKFEQINSAVFRDVNFPPIDFPNDIENQTIALIAHDAMKNRMIEFAIDHEHELEKFKRILATGTTGREIIANTRALDGKVKRYRSGPKGGDIEIATEVLFGRCHAVIFFTDPLNPHPHIEDIRVVLGSCMLKDKVRILTNEMQARDWMRRVVRTA